MSKRLKLWIATTSGDHKKHCAKGLGTAFRKEDRFASPKLKLSESRVLKRCLSASPQNAKLEKIR
jgi:hypothetical protein